MFARLIFALTAVLGAAPAAQAIDFPATPAGPAHATLEGPQLTMENALLHARWDLSPGKRRLADVVDRATGTRLSCDSDLFRVKLADGTEMAAAEAFATLR